MPNLKPVLAALLLGLPIACGSYVARQNYLGYCFAQHRYLSDQEKVASVVVHLLQNYPPAMLRTPVEPGVWHATRPQRPLYYTSVADFLARNPDCCALSLTRKELEGSGPTLMERVTGTVSAFVGTEYKVRYRDDQDSIREIAVTGFQAISNCGKPSRKWYPGDYFFEFHPSNL